MPGFIPSNVVELERVQFFLECCGGFLIYPLEGVAAIYERVFFSFFLVLLSLVGFVEIVLDFLESGGDTLA